MKLRRSFIDSADGPPEWLGVAWVAAAGFVMGSFALSLLLIMDGRIRPTGPLGLLACGLPTALLSAAAAVGGGRCRSPGMQALAVWLLSALASVLCPALTWIVLVVTGGDGGVPGAELFAVLIFGTLFGAFIAVPIALVFGVVYGAALALLAWLRRRPSGSTRDVAGVALGALSVLVGLAGALPWATSDIAASRAARAAAIGVPGVPVALGVAFALAGAIAALVLGARLARRARLVDRIARGEVEGWAVVAEEDVDGYEALPRLFAFRHPIDVLVRREAHESGPFRSGEATTPVARV